MASQAERLMPEVASGAKPQPSLPRATLMLALADCWERSLEKAVEPRPMTMQREGAVLHMSSPDQSMPLALARPWMLRPLSGPPRVLALRTVGRGLPVVA